MIQIVLLSLLLAPAWACRLGRCYSEEELDSVAERKLMSLYPQPPEPPVPAESDSAAPCMLQLFNHQQDYNERSLSPWRYVRVIMKDHYPSSYVAAKCLCTGCIVIKNKSGPMLSYDYNSVPITQSRVFLKREPCTTGDGKYQLTPVSVDVAVGCTCARPKTT